MKLPVIQSGAGRDDGPVGVNIDEVEIFDPDKVKELREQAVGKEGMKVDRKLFERFQEQIKDDEEVKEAVEKEQWERAVEITRDKYEDKPKLYPNPEKIRKGENLDRRLNWKEVLERIFGKIDKFKTKNEKLEEECEKFISIYKPESKYISYIKDYLKAYTADEYFRNEINNKRFPKTYAGFTMQQYKALNGYREKIPEYVKDYVSVNQYMR